MAATVGIVDYHGHVHCMEHASTVGSYREEIRSTDPARHCWCGKRVGGRKAPAPGPTMAYRTMNDGVKGKRDVSGVIPSRQLRRHA